VYSGPYGKDHIPFMDMADKYGFKVIYPLIGDKTEILTKTTQQMERLIMNQIDEIGYHPALVMYTFGNELGTATADQSFIDSLNHFFNFIRTYQEKKWGRKIPVSIAEVDLPSSYEKLASTLDVDVFSTNAGYRGFTFTDLWTGNSGASGWQYLSCKYNKPLFIGEIGQHSTDNFVNSDSWFSSVWADLYSHINEGCIGGAFFEWNDEPMKAGPQQTMGLVSLQVATWKDASGNTLTSRTENAWNPDLIVKKTTPGAYNWDAVNNSNGLYNVSMHTDPFDFIGRKPYTLPEVGPCICDSVSDISSEEKDAVCATPTSLPHDGHSITGTGDDFSFSSAPTSSVGLSLLVIITAFIGHFFLLL